MRSHGQETRRQAIGLWEQGVKKSEISRQLGVDYDTLLGWIKRFSQEGESALSFRYDRCGRKPLGDSNAVKCKALELKGKHGEWGAGYLRVHLVRAFPGEKIVQPRQIQRWISEKGLVPKRTQLPPVPGDWVKKPLERVQVDAKERLKTKDGKECCYLNFIDEHTGSELDAFVFPPREDQPGSAKRNI
jgi:transposase